MKIGLIGSKQIYEIIINLLDKFEKSTLQVDQCNQNDELSEILYIMITNSCDYLSKDDSEIVINKVKNIGTLSPGKFPSLSNKAIFKFMDILDKI